MIKKSFCEASHSHSHSPIPTHSHSHSHLILDPGSAYPDDAGGGFAPSSVIVVCRSRIQDQVAVAVGTAAAVDCVVGYELFDKKFLILNFQKFLTYITPFEFKNFSCFEHARRLRTFGAESS